MLHSPIVQLTFLLFAVVPLVFNVLGIRRHLKDAAEGVVVDAFDPKVL